VNPFNPQRPKSQDKGGLEKRKIREEKIIGGKNNLQGMHKTKSKKGRDFLERGWGEHFQ